MAARHPVEMRRGLKFVCAIAFSHTVAWSCACAWLVWDAVSDLSRTGRPLSIDGHASWPASIALVAVLLAMAVSGVVFSVLTLWYGRRALRRLTADVRRDS